MRKLLLLTAAVPLLLAPPAVAATDHHDARADKAGSVCRPPEVTHSYGTNEMAVHVTLPAAGCASRENSMFMVSAQITRTDVFGPQESVWRAVRCGPFRPAADHGADETMTEYFCDLDVALEHPSVETNDYQIEVTYPGAAAERTLTLSLACTSDGESAVCDKETA